MECHFLMAMGTVVAVIAAYRSFFRIPFGPEFFRPKAPLSGCAGKKSASIICPMADSAWRDILLRKCFMPVNPDLAGRVHSMGPPVLG